MNINNNLQDEFSNNIKVTNSLGTNSTNEQPSFDEFSLQNKPSTKKKKSSSKLSKLLTTFLATTVASVSVGIGVVTPIKEQIVPTYTAKVELLEFGQAGYDIFYTLEVDSKTTLEVVLYNNFTNRRFTLENGGNGGAFEGLKIGVPYTFAVVGKDVIGEREILSRKITLEHPVKEAYLGSISAGIDGEIVAFSLYVDSLVPLTAKLTDPTGKIYLKELINGQNEDMFLVEEIFNEYTFSIVGQGLWGEEILHTEILTTL